MAVSDSTVFYSDYLQLRAVSRTGGPARTLTTGYVPSMVVVGEDLYAANEQQVLKFVGGLPPGVAITQIDAELRALPPMGRSSIWRATAGWSRWRSPAVRPRP